jgi:peptidoglycan/xylan/chitin deacetylase (PgdA/CDA1 family)
MRIRKIAARAIWTLFIWGIAVVLAGTISAGLDRIGETLLLVQNKAAETLAEAVQLPVSDNLEAAETENIQEEKYVALTFDDGPHPVYTPKLLDGLAEREVHATFFVIGSNIPGNESIIERMHQEGHLIGNHTYDHVKISTMNAADACAQVEKTSALVREITGEDTEFVRPPFGAWNKEMETPFVMIPVLWDVDPLDWTTKNTSQVVQNVLGEVESGDIILLHDCYDSSVEAAFQIIDELKRQGYEFRTVDEMILE